MSFKRDPQFFINDILEQAKKIIDKSSAITLHELSNNEDLAFSLIKRIEIIGEASSKLPKEFILRTNHIPGEKL